jgi:hypothetical protein
MRYTAHCDLIHIAAATLNIFPVLCFDVKSAAAVAELLQDTRAHAVRPQHE